MAASSNSERPDRARAGSAERDLVGNDSISGDSTEVAAIPVARFQRLIGFRIVEWQAGRAVVSLDIREEHLNRAGSVHGGVLATLIDAAGGLLRQLQRRQRAAASRDQPDARHQLPRQRADGADPRGRRAARWRIQDFFASVDIFSEAGELLATGQGSYRLAASGAGAG